MERLSKQFKKRNAIWDFLRHSTAHPSAETVYGALKPEIPDLSLGTVYRNLALFKKQGRIVSVGSFDGVERFDGNVEPHAHFVCDCCGAIIDLPDIAVPEESLALVEQWGEVSGCRMVFIGKCGNCREKTVSAG